jgi:prepilin-type N-terminal cleavage/methylation domain-containing protein
MVEYGQTVQMTETEKMLHKGFHCGLRIADCGIKTPNSLPSPERFAQAGELRTLNSEGFTLIEVILAMILVGILAAFLMPKINFTLPGTTSVYGAAYMVASDIRYAQECAMANRISKTVAFTSGQNFYTFPATVPSTSQLDPSGRLPSGVTIGTTITITFNSLGEPTSIPVGTGSVTISISGVGGPRTITVLNYTGKVDIS